MYVYGACFLNMSVVVIVWGMFVVVKESPTLLENGL